MSTLVEKKPKKEIEVSFKKEACDTLPKLLLYQCQKNPERRAMRVKVWGIWKSYTWSEYYKHVKYFALGLASIGFEKGDKIAIVGENHPQWYWGELAAQSLGGTAIGIFIDSVSSEVKYIAEHCDAKFAIAHDQEQVDKFLEIKSEIPLVKKIIYWDPKGLWFYSDPDLMAFEQVEEKGKEFEKKHPGFFENNIAKGTKEDIGVICYTSGTTGIPKGVMLSHRALIGTCRAWSEVENWSENNEYLSFLAPAWATDQYLGISGNLLIGFTVNFPEDPETVQENLREIGPHIVFYSSRLWEVTSGSIYTKIRESGKFNRFMYDHFLKIGLKVMGMKLRGKKINFLWKFLYKIADILLFRCLRDRIGLSNIQSAVSAGAAVSPDILTFFNTIGINVKQLYGITEIGVATVHRDKVRPETSGPPVPNCEVRLSPEGEILIRNPFMFSGYYKFSEGYKEKVDDAGWYYSGDFGHMEDGQLIVMDRMDDLKGLSNGKKFSPQYIEIRLRFSPYIKDALILGDKEKQFIAAIINIDFDNVGKWAEVHHINYTTFTDLSQKEEVCELIKQEIEGVNNILPDWMRVKKFINLYKEFDPDEAELTRTRKIKRNVVEKRYSDLIDSIYSNVSVTNVESEFIYRDGKKAKIKTEVKVRRILDV